MCCSFYTIYFKNPVALCLEELEGKYVFTSEGCISEMCLYSVCAAK